MKVKFSTDDLIVLIDDALAVSTINTKRYNFMYIRDHVILFFSEIMQLRYEVKAEMFADFARLQVTWYMTPEAAVMSVCA